MKLQTVPAATGLQWVRLGVTTFLRQPLAMAGLFFLYMGSVSALALLPLLGMAVTALLTPAINLGLMSATREALDGRFPMPSQLLTAFRGGPQRTRSMLVLGSLYGFALMAVMLVAGMAEAALANPAAPLPADPTPEEAMRLAMASPALWIAMAVMLPLQVLFWFAPALVFWHDVPPVKSLFFSLMAAWTNKLALALFLVGWFTFFSLVALLMSALSALLGGATFMQVALYPTVLLLVSMFFTSIYFPFRDSFLPPAP